MMLMTRLPVIAILGRPNVGKSSLLNALAGKRISIVEDVPGVTRDRVSAPIQINGRWVELVDTGGFGLADPDQLTEHIRHQIDLAIARAKLVLLVADCQAGLTSADQQIASLLRHRGIRTILVANKADGQRADIALGEFARLGLGTPLGVSAKNGRNVDLLVDAIRRNVDLSAAPAELPEPSMHIAIVGKRNAGKSTLVNSIARIYEGEGDRVIVSELPGTTRDSIDVRIEKDGRSIVVIDTAGVRKKRQMVTHDLEFYSLHRARRSIRRSDVVLLLVDATEPLSEPDRKLAQYVADQFKPVVLVINKWDLARQIIRERRGLSPSPGTPPSPGAPGEVRGEGLPSPVGEGRGEGAARRRSRDLDDRALMVEYREYLAAELPHLDFAPVAFTTATDGKNVQSALDIAQHLVKQSAVRITTGRLNNAVQRIFQERTPSTPSGRRPRVYYATQIDVSPPMIVLVVNNPLYIDESYQRFIVNRLRELLPYPQVPIRLILRPRLQRTGGDTQRKPSSAGERTAPAPGRQRDRR